MFLLTVKKLERGIVRYANISRCCWAAEIKKGLLEEKKPSYRYAVQ